MLIALDDFNQKSYSTVVKKLSAGVDGKVESAAFEVGSCEDSSTLFEMFVTSLSSRISRFVVSSIAFGVVESSKSSSCGFVGLGRRVLRDRLVRVLKMTKMF